MLSLGSNYKDTLLLHFQVAGFLCDAILKALEVHPGNGVCGKIASDNGLRSDKQHV